MINALRSLVGKLEGKRTVGRSRRRRDDIKWSSMSGSELINIAQDRGKYYPVEDTVTYVRVAQNAGNLVTS
jgi:hypothetical protein